MGRCRQCDFVSLVLVSGSAKIREGVGSNSTIAVMGVNLLRFSTKLSDVIGGGERGGELSPLWLQEDTEISTRVRGKMFPTKTDLP